MLSMTRLSPISYRWVAEGHEKPHDEDATERRTQNSPDGGCRLDEYRREVGRRERQPDRQGAEKKHFDTETQRSR